MKHIYLILMLMVSYSTLSCTSGPARFNQMAMDDAKLDKDFIPYLKIKKGEIIGIIGAGGGYYSVKLAKATGEKGKVYAVEIDPESIKYINKYARDNGVNNIETVLGTFTSSNLKDASVETIFLRNSYHDIGNRVSYFSRLRSVLKTGGKIVILDYDPDKLGFFRNIFGHNIKKEIIIKEMNQAGYYVVKSYSFLKKQSFTIFKIKPANK
ncbi:MAG: class I SAM-dependent methyltransferase [Spirochaetota bacterium]|nr:class I SAM-dependent methyltransferase [Spirochaetota bacterium]